MNEKKQSNLAIFLRRNGLSLQRLIVSVAFVLSVAHVLPFWQALSVIFGVWLFLLPKTHIHSGN